MITLALHLALATPPGLVPLAEAAPGIVQAMSYAGADNFLGRPASGYERPDCRLTARAAAALARVQRAALVEGLSLVVHDCFRPRAASRAFVAWLGTPEDPSTRARFHPTVPKNQLVRRGYIAPHSAHTAGETVDVTLASFAAPEVPLDLGTPFDFFDPRSAHGARDVSPEAASRRATLARLMHVAGFRAYRREWWHYTLRP